MYNTIKLRPEHWTYQRYWWHPTLDPECDLLEKIIKTLIYGVRPSGNQGEFGLRETARMQQVEYPDAADSLLCDTTIACACTFGTGACLSTAQL